MTFFLNDERYFEKSTRESVNFVKSPFIIAESSEAHIRRQVYSEAHVRCQVYSEAHIRCQVYSEARYHPGATKSGEKGVRGIVGPLISRR